MAAKFIRRNKNIPLIKDYLSNVDRILNKKTKAETVIDKDTKTIVGWVVVDKEEIHSGVA